MWQYLEIASYILSLSISLENPLIESDDEQAVASEIERDLAEVSPLCLN